MASALMVIGVSAWYPDSLCLCLYLYFVDPFLFSLSVFYYGISQTQEGNILGNKHI